MFKAVITASDSGRTMLGHLDESRECASVYLLARQRQKGCEEN